MFVSYSHPQPECQISGNKPPYVPGRYVAWLMVYLFWRFVSTGICHSGREYSYYMILIQYQSPNGDCVPIQSSVSAHWILPKERVESSSAWSASENELGRPLIQAVFFELWSSLLCRWKPAVGVLVIPALSQLAIGR